MPRWIWFALVGGLVILKLRLQTMDALFESIAAQYGIRPGVMESLVEHESGFNPAALGDAGQSRGLGQIWASTARRLGVTDLETLFEPKVNLTLIARLLVELHKRSYDGEDVIAGYNAGTPMKKGGVYVNTKGVPNVQRYVNAVRPLLLERGIDPQKESLFV